MVVPNVALRCHAVCSHLHQRQRDSAQHQSLLHSAGDRQVQRADLVRDCQALAQGPVMLAQLDGLPPELGLVAQYLPERHGLHVGRRRRDCQEMGSQRDDEVLAVPGRPRVHQSHFWDCSSFHRKKVEIVTKVVSRCLPF